MEDGKGEALNLCLIHPPSLACYPENPSPSTHHIGKFWYLWQQYRATGANAHTLVQMVAEKLNGSQLHQWRASAFAGREGMFCTAHLRHPKLADFFGCALTHTCAGIQMVSKESRQNDLRPLLMTAVGSVGLFWLNGAASTNFTRSEHCRYTMVI